MESPNCLCKNSVDKCDIFDFMSKYVGLSVLHPGGFVANNRLLFKCGLDKTKHVLDVACGKGTTTVHIAKKYGCRVVGVDICPGLVREAKKNAARNKLSHLVDIQLADAAELPFASNSFDVVIAQAMLVLMDNNELVTREAVRVLKPGGKAGWIELTWQKPPDNNFMEQVSDVICAYCMPNVRTKEKWLSLFNTAGAQNLHCEMYPMQLNGLIGMTRDKGFVNSIRVMAKFLFQKKVRERMMKMEHFFKQYEHIFGYGIYTMDKE